MNEKEVIRIGRSRVRAACTAALRGVTPSSSFWRANSTIRIAFLAARPTRTTKPIWARMSIGKPRASKPVTDARRHIGTIKTIASGSFQLSYCATKTRNRSAGRQSFRSAGCNRHLSAGRSLTAVGSDDESSHGGRHAPNHAPTVASSVLHYDIAGRQQHLHAIIELECHVAGENDPEIRRVGPVHAGFVAVLHVHPGEGFRCNHVGLRRVRRYEEADATYGWEWSGRRRIVPRVRVGCGPIGGPEEGELP